MSDDIRSAKGIGIATQIERVRNLLQHSGMAADHVLAVDLERRFNSGLLSQSAIYGMTSQLGALIRLARIDGEPVLSTDFEVFLERLHRYRDGEASTKRRSVPLPASSVASFANKVTLFIYQACNAKPFADARNQADLATLIKTWKEQDARAGRVARSIAVVRHGDGIVDLRDVRAWRPNHSSHVRDRALILLAGETGLPFAALLALKPAGVVPGKPACLRYDYSVLQGIRTVDVPLTPLAETIVAERIEWLATAGLDAPFIFPGHPDCRRDAQQLSTNSLSLVLKSAIRRAGLNAARHDAATIDRFVRRVSPRSVETGFIVDLLMAGLHPPAIIAWRRDEFTSRVEKVRTMLADAGYALPAAITTPDRRNAA